MALGKKIGGRSSRLPEILRRAKPQVFLAAQVLHTADQSWLSDAGECHPILHATVD